MSAIKKGFKLILKILASLIFLGVLIFGVLLLTQKIPSVDYTMEAYKFWGIAAIVLGLIFGVIPWLRVFLSILKFALSLFGIVVLVFGVCALLNCQGWVAINWANIGTSQGALIASIVMIVGGVLFGVIPFFGFFKKIGRAAN